jgi:RHS repeat-associated protein
MITRPLRFISKPDSKLSDYVAGSAAASPKYNYVYASYIDEPVLREEPATSTKLFFHRNQQYSIIDTTDGGGSVTERITYDAYGTPEIADSHGIAQTSSMKDNRFFYTARELDELLILYFYRSRLYEYRIGRFCSRDTIRYEGSEWSLYKFVNSKPIDSLDAAGKSKVNTIWQCVKAFFGGKVNSSQGGNIKLRCLGWPIWMRKCCEA